MDERLLNEFAAYYKRILRVEKYLKNLIFEKYTQYHKDKAYQHIYSRYLINLKSRQKINDQTFIKIYKDKHKTNNQKLQLSIDKMYISEVLSLFSHKVFLKDIVRKTFFENDIKTNKNEFRLIAKHFKEFRNCICHFDTKQFSIDNKTFVKSLIFFEKLVNCKYRFSLGSVEAIAHKTNITSILKYIYSTHPEYFKDDRILVNVFDDIARLLDFRKDNLPQYKSIIRQKFEIEKMLKTSPSP